MGGVAFCVSPGESRLGYVGFTCHPTSALIWLHGLGDTEKNWERILNNSVLPTIGSCMLVVPRAPRAPVTCNSGHVTGRWFDMKELPLNASNKDSNYGCSWADAQLSAKKVHGIIDQIRSHGIPAERIAVGGFSQGAALAMLSALQYSQPLACCIAFSGWLLGGDDLSSLDSQENHDLEILWCHGEHDRIILPSMQRVGCAALERVGLQVDRRRYPTGHSTHPEALEQATSFLREHFEATPPAPPSNQETAQFHRPVSQSMLSPRHAGKLASLTREFSSVSWDGCQAYLKAAGVDGNIRSHSKSRIVARTKEGLLEAIQKSRAAVKVNGKRRSRSMSRMPVQRTLSKDGFKESLAKPPQPVQPRGDDGMWEEDQFGVAVSGHSRCGS